MPSISPFMSSFYLSNTVMWLSRALNSSIRASLLEVATFKECLNWLVSAPIWSTYYSLLQICASVSATWLAKVLDAYAFLSPSIWEFYYTFWWAAIPSLALWIAAWRFAISPDPWAISPFLLSISALLASFYLSKSASRALDLDKSASVILNLSWVSTIHQFIPSRSPWVAFNSTASYDPEDLSILILSSNSAI